MNTTKKLRLGPLPKTESIRLTFACPVGLKADLDRYAALLAQTYGKAVDIVTLIPHMLEAFIAVIAAFLEGSEGSSLRSGHRSNLNSKNRSFKQRPTAYSFAQVIERFRWSSLTTCEIFK